MTTVADVSPDVQVPSPEDPAYTAWYLACGRAADALAATAEPKRLAHALALAITHKVTMTLEDPEIYAEVASGKKIYRLTPEGHCPCEDARRGHTCKHVLAVMITQNAIPFGGAVDTIVEEALVVQPVPETPLDAAPVSAPVPLPQVSIQNPAGFNFEAKVGNARLWYTFHDSADAPLLERIKLVLPQLQDLVTAAEDHLAQRQDAQRQRQDAQRPEAPVQGNGRFPASTNNGTHPPETNDTNREWCSVHRVEMTFHPANDNGPAWYSHRLGQGGYCKGGY